MNKQRRVALYVRVSTDSQFEEGYSVDAQLEKLKAYCTIKNYDAYEPYIDGGWSGSNIERPEMKRMIRDIQAGEISAVIVYKLDRLSRSQKDTIFLLEDVFNPNDCDFISINENFDTTSPYGKAMIGILSVFAQLERENIRERTRMGMQERVKSGLWPGGDGVPFGYDYDRTQGILVPNNHADDVRKIFDLYIQGYSTTRLANMFDVASDRHITQILDRITYLGKIKYNGEIYDGQHEAIVDAATYTRAQLERKKRSTKNVVTSKYLLTGLLECGCCGAKLRYQRWGKKLKMYCYSRQTSKPDLVKDPHCNNAVYDAEQIEAAVLHSFFEATDNVQALEKAVSNTDSALRTLETRYEQLKGKIKRLYNLYAQSEDELLLETLNENRAELGEVEKMIAREKEMQTTTQLQDNLIAMAKNVRNVWDTLSIDEKHRILRAYINKIVITHGNIEIYYNF